MRPEAIRLRATPAGGTWAGTGVSGSAATGFVFEAASLPSGSVTLTYTPDAGSCALPRSQQISVAAVPNFTPAYTAPRCPEVQAAPRQIVFADATGNAATRWNFGDGTPAATGASVAHTYAQPGTYYPTATLPYGPPNTCALLRNLPPVEVKPLFLPNVVTPNADGLNDTFKPTFACRPHLKIFSRWGQLVYENAAYANDWTAADQPGGIYYFLLDDGSGQTQHGWVEVVK